MSSGGSSGCPPSSAAKDRRAVLSEILGNIHGHYKAALNRLPAEELPTLIPRLLETDVCFGLLDPVSNIIANTPLPEPNTAAQCEEEDPEERSRRGTKRKASTAAAEEDEDEGEAQRMRDGAMLEITTDASSISILPPRLNERGVSNRRTVAQRSLEGLVTFLICYFRNLPITEALQFLLTAKADLLAAVQLIELTRPMGGRLCAISSQTTEIALRCAAVSASHPEPAVLASKSLLLASHFEQLSQILTIGGGCLSPDAINRLRKLLDEPLEQRADSPKPVRHALIRLNGYIRGTCKLNKCPFASTETLRTLILEKMHLLYLKAMAQLRKDALGCCADAITMASSKPASALVLLITLSPISSSTPSAFPQRQEFKVDVICTNSIVRIGCRSLSGLLAFLHSLFPALTEHEAMLHLFCSNANLHEVVFGAMQDHGISGSYEDAYRAAAEAAFHPHPEAQAEFAVSTSPTLLPTLESSEEVGRALTSNELELISRYFSKKSVKVGSVSSVTELVPSADKIVKQNQERFNENQYFIRRKVKAALQRYATEKGTQYELHVVCGTNFEVPENGKHGYFNNHNGYPYIHVNFLATPKGSQPDNTASKLFFLECSNIEKDVDIQSWFCTLIELPTDSGRCFHCEYKGNKIVHPAFGTYRGRETDFEELASGERRAGNEGLILFDKLMIDCVGVLCEDDSVYFDPIVDSEFAQGMNDIVKEEEEAREEFFRQDIAVEDAEDTNTEEEQTCEDDYYLSEDEEGHEDHNSEALDVDCAKAREEEAHDELCTEALAL
ncbi:hypothetical protein EJB05_04757, partial [Eragrostis curvula]